jgi:hypothetical protein
MKLLIILILADIFVLMLYVSRIADGGSKVLRNTDNLPQHYMASQLSRSRHAFPLACSESEVTSDIMYRLS